MMRTSTGLFGIFGGTFDPIHRGHIAALRQVKALTRLEEIFFVPARVPHHRPPPSASAAQRLRMVQIAVADEAGFYCDDRELRRRPPSYMSETIHAFRQERPDDMPCLIVGLDAALTLERWHQWRQVIEQAHLLVMQRPHWRLPDPLPDWWCSRQIELPLRAHTPPGILLLAIQPHALSATAIRRRIAAAENAADDVPAGVWEYICASRLYQSG